MIKNITSSSPYLVIDGGNPMMPYISPGAQGAGQVRYNTNNSNLEVWDGVTWKEISTSYNTSINLSSNAQELLKWAEEKRNKEMKLAALAQSHPAVADVVAKLKSVEEELKVVVALTEENKV
jgi:CobQ-like glutamine amidotransferase family enzyme